MILLVNKQTNKPWTATKEVSGCFFVKLKGSKVKRVLFIFDHTYFFHIDACWGEANLDKGMHGMNSFSQ